MTSVVIEEKTLGALVVYDLFPYIIFREVRQIRDDGRIGNYGYWHRPLVLLPYAAAEEMYNKILAVAQEYEAAKRQIKNDAMEKIRTIAPDATAAIGVYNKPLEGK
jgi:hypothetical protein